MFRHNQSGASGSSSSTVASSSETNFSGSATSSMSSSPPSNGSPRSDAMMRGKKIGPRAASEASKHEEAEGGCQDGCTCGSFATEFEVYVKAYFPRLYPSTQDGVDRMLLDKRLWDGASPVTWESIKKMYDCNQSSPIDSAIMDRCIKAFNQSAQPGRLLLDTRFFKTLSTFCLCSEGKCKYKGTFPLDSAMSACGHHDCMRDIGKVAAREVGLDPKVYLTDFGLITYDERFSALLVLCAAEMIATTNLPTNLHDTHWVLRALTKLVAVFGSEELDVAIRKATAPGEDSKRSATSVLNKPKSRKTKNLKARVANVKNPGSISKPVPVSAPTPKMTRYAPIAIASTGPRLQQPTTGEKVISYTSVAPTTSGDAKGGKVAPNSVEKILLDRITWTVAMERPTYVPSPNLQQLEALLGISGPQRRSDLSRGI